MKRISIPFSFYFEPDIHSSSFEYQATFTLGLRVLGSLPVLFSDGDNICKPVRVLFLPNKADVAKAPLSLSFP